MFEVERDLWQFSSPALDEFFDFLKLIPASSVSKFVLGCVTLLPLYTSF